MIKAGDFILPIKKDNAYYICGRATPEKDDCRWCDFLKPCKIIIAEECAFSIEAYGLCNGFFALPYKDFDEHFVKIKSYNWKKL